LRRNEPIITGCSVFERDFIRNAAPANENWEEFIHSGATVTAYTAGTSSHPQRDKTEGHYMSAAGKFKDATGRLKQNSPLPFLP